MVLGIFPTNYKSYNCCNYFYWNTIINISKIMVNTTNKILVPVDRINIGQKVWIARLSYASYPEGVHIIQESKIKPTEVVIKRGINLESGKGIKKYIIEYPSDNLEIIVSENNNPISPNGLIISLTRDECFEEYNKFYEKAYNELQEFIEEIKYCFDNENYKY